MTYPRAHLVDAENGGEYHVHTRCVRRAWLCGEDPYSGESYEHRKAWLEQRILSLASVFSVTLRGYCIMSNHYHLIIKTDPKAPLKWSDEEVAERWYQASFSKYEAHKAREKKADLDSPERLAQLRNNLGSLSTFMRYINEPLSRMSNREDGCTGSFVQGRFKSSSLLDDPSILRCMVYVDLNPVRAGITDCVTEAPSTSLKRRWDSSDNFPPLEPLSTLGLTLNSYVELVQWTANSNKHPANDAHHAMPSCAVEVIGCAPSNWVAQVNRNRHRYRAYGSSEQLAAYATRLGQQRVGGFRDSPAGSGLGP